MNRCGYDRRCDNDRRQTYDVNYFENGGCERRKRQDRRMTGETRDGWQRINEFSSIAVGNCPSEQKPIKNTEGIPTWVIS